MLVGSAADQLTPIAVVAGGLFWTRASTGFTVADIYASLAVVSLISTPLIFLSYATTKIGAALACWQRIHTFLTLGKLPDDRENPNSSRTEKNGFRISTRRQQYHYGVCTIQMIQVSTLPLENGRQILRDITIYCAPRTVTMIVGPVGCGKSTLLKLLLGEAQIIEGRIMIDKNRIAYCDQTAWIPNLTIQRIILGENAYSKEWYDTVIFACNLLHDFRRMRNGDQTVAGTGGCNLSGGQKQRIVSACLIIYLTDIVTNLIILYLRPLLAHSILEDRFSSWMISSVV